MELQKLVAVDVKTLDGDNDEINLTFGLSENDDGISCSDILRKSCKSLGLSKTSLQSFSLFVGLKKLLKRLKENEALKPPVPELCIRKWIFSKKKEASLIQSDPVAAHLIYLEALLHIAEGNLQIENPNPPIQLYDTGQKIQFLLNCHQDENYMCAIVRNCQITNSYIPASQKETDPALLDQPRTVTISTQGVKVSTHYDSHLYCTLPLNCIRQWTISANEQTLDFEYRVVDPVHMVFFANMVVTTDQAAYLLAVVNQCCKEYQEDKGEALLFFSSMIQTKADGSTEWTNPLYNEEEATKQMMKQQFSS